MTTNVLDAHPLGASTTTANTKTELVLLGAKPLRPDSLNDNPLAENVPVAGDMTIPDVDADAGYLELTFIPERCLFCNLLCLNVDGNISHMHKNHGLFIPLEIEDGALALVVDLETLVQYLHLVVSGYNECLFCHTGRQTTEAVKQHMMDKGHCRINLDRESEFRDFYEEAEDDSAASEDALDENETCLEGDDETARDTTRGKPRNRHLSFETDGSLLCLSFGKVLSHRSAPPPRHHRPLAETQKISRGSDHKLPGSSSTSRAITQALRESTEGDVPGTPTQAASSRALTRFERRAESNDRSTLSFALSRLSTNDHAALGHLPAGQQRAIVLRQFKQQDEAGSRERRYRGKSNF